MAEYKEEPNSFLYSVLMSCRSSSERLTMILVNVDSVVPAPWKKKFLFKKSARFVVESLWKKGEYRKTDLTFMLL